MSRVGKKPIKVPKDVKINIADALVEVQGPKGKLTTPIPAGVTFKLEDGNLVAERAGNEYTAMHGTVRALVANAVTGVSTITAEVPGTSTATKTTATVTNEPPTRAPDCGARRRCR